MESEGVDVGGTSVVGVVPPARPRKLAKVPFVELADGRLQGVVSSGSDIARVYVSSITAGSHALSCGTNNNRPCGGQQGTFLCKHLRALVAEAVTQFGLRRVADYLRVSVDGEADALVAALTPGVEPSPPAGVVFSRFLRYLTYLELPGTTAPLPEMHWFPARGVSR
ncbi:hypothetical protein GCM10027294_43310 [Marinactinospora endophytica]